MSEKAKKKNQNEESPETSGEDDGLAALSALVRASSAPPAPEKEADDGKLDLRALTASLPPPQPMEPVERAAASDDEDDEDEDEDESEAEAAAEPEPAPPPKKAKKKKKAAAKPRSEEPERPKAAVRPQTEVAQPSQSSGNGMWIGVAVVGLLVAGVAIWQFGGFNDTNADETEDALASSAPTQVEMGGEEEARAEVETEVEVAEQPPEPAAEPAVEPVAEEPAAEEPAAEEPAAEPVAEVEAEARTERERPSRTGRERPAQQAAEPAQPAAEARVQARVEAQPQQPRQERNIESMLDQALGGRPNAEGTRTEPAQQPRAEERPAQAPPAQNTGDLPAEPDRAQVARTLGRLMPRIRQCAGDQVGMAMAGIVISGDGSVATVNVSGSPFGGTPQGACMEGAIREARFPAFRGTSHRVNYPFNIR